MPQASEIRHVVRADVEPEQGRLLTKSTGDTPRKVQLAGHRRVTSWGSTSCSSRTPSPPVVRREVLQGSCSQKQRLSAKTQPPLLPPVNTIPHSGSAMVPSTLVPQASIQQMGRLTLRPHGAQAAYGEVVPLSSFQYDTSTLLQLAGLRPPPGLSLPPGLHLPAGRSSTSPAMTKILCGVCEEHGEDLVRAGPHGEACASEEDTVYLSAGSVGHPYTCAGACRYVKRKGGCRDGRSCPNCHLCFWSRAAENDAGNDNAQQEAAVVSVGTRGHPHHCGAACKYAHRKGGCRDGASCTKCHACFWQREMPKEAARPTAPELPPTPEIRQSYLGESGEKLAELIAELLSRHEL